MSTSPLERLVQNVLVIAARARSSGLTDNPEMAGAAVLRLATNAERRRLVELAQLVDADADDDDRQAVVRVELPPSLPPREQEALAHFFGTTAERWAEEHAVALRVAAPRGLHVRGTPFVFIIFTDVEIPLKSRGRLAELATAAAFKAMYPVLTREGSIVGESAD